MILGSKDVDAAWLPRILMALPVADVEAHSFALACQLVSHIEVDSLSIILRKIGQLQLIGVNRHSLRRGCVDCEINRRIV
jgi:hypothetical protein